MGNRPARRDFDFRSGANAKTLLSNSCLDVIPKLDVLTSTFNLYSKVYPASSINDLGGNLSTGASGADSNYLVIVKPNI
jgi:hypothetical protein